MTEWAVVRWGIGGDSVAYRCPRANLMRPDKSPDCFIELNGGETDSELRMLRRRHQKRVHR